MVLARFVTLEPQKRKESSRAARTPAPLLSLGPGLGVMLALSVGGESVIGALVTADGKKHYEQDAYEINQLAGSPERLMARIRKVAVAVLEEAFERDELLVTDGDTRGLKLIGVTVAWPTPMDRESVPQGTSLPADWRDRPLRERIAETLDLDIRRCHSLNDSNAGALTVAFEWDGEAGDETVMCIHLAKGIGLGTAHMPIPRENELPFVQAHLVGGTYGIFAGEIGHTRVDRSLIEDLNERIAHQADALGIKPLNPNRACPGCGPQGSGHLEAVVGAEAVLERLEPWTTDQSLVGGLKQLHWDVARKEPNALHVLRDVGRAVGRTMGGIVAATDPARIMLTGSLASEQVALGMKERVAEGDLNDRVVIECFEEDDRTSVALRGAALATLRAGLYRGFFNDLEYAGTLTDRYVGPRPWAAWTKWDSTVNGVQTGSMSSRETDTSWIYRPDDYTREMLDRLKAQAAPATKRRKTARRRD